MPQRNALIRYFSMLLCICMGLLLLSAGVADQDSVRAAIEKKGDNTRYIQVPGRGEELFYAQRNPMFNRMIYEYRRSQTSRIFGDGGCGPASASAALMALLDGEDLMALGQHTKDGQPYSVCQHTMNAWSCAKCKERLQIVTPEDYVKYLPIILASYACGNNDVGEVWRRASVSKGGTGGTGMQFLHNISSILSLTCTEPEDVNDPSWLDQVGENAVAVALSASSPFTGGGHYVAVMWVDEEHIYIFDPMQPESYSKKSDKRRILTAIEPGLVQVKRENYKNLGFYSVYVISDEQQLSDEQPQ